VDQHPRRSPYVVDYRKDHFFDAPPARIWALVEEPELFPRMWPWMKQPRLVAERVEPGAVLSFVIDPPFPYRMSVKATFTDVREERSVAADISGDLEGTASMQLRAHDGGTTATVAWKVEIKQRRMRVAARLARPLLIRGHNWAVEVALRGFRRRLKGTAA
jgi:uncharacterized protein YndB with AHSA1/START domain